MPWEAPSSSRTGLNCAPDWPTTRTCSRASTNDLAGCVRSGRANPAAGRRLLERGPPRAADRRHRRRTPRRVLDRENYCWVRSRKLPPEIREAAFLPNLKRYANEKREKALRPGNRIEPVSRTVSPSSETPPGLQGRGIRPGKREATDGIRREARTDVELGSTGCRENGMSTTRKPLPNQPTASLAQRRRAERDSRIRLAILQSAGS